MIVNMIITLSVMVFSTLMFICGYIWGGYVENKKQEIKELEND